MESMIGEPNQLHIGPIDIQMSEQGASLCCGLKIYTVTLELYDRYLVPWKGHTGVEITEEEVAENESTKFWARGKWIGL